jgi:hypothetical protein
MYELFDETRYRVGTGALPAGLFSRALQALPLVLGITAFLQ